MACSREATLSALSIIAPLHLAEAWDNVGLLVDGAETDEFSRAFLTIDLTEAVLDEAEDSQADLIIAYHPPIFSGLKRLRREVPVERVILRCIREGRAIYSPHTALDAVPGGMTDWLSLALGPGLSTPIIPDLNDVRAGAGRLIQLDEAVSMEQAIASIKSHLGLSHLRLSAQKADTLIQKVAVCPGAGGSVFEKVDFADLFLTGEMRHHDVLKRRASGSHVILTDHTNTERAFLPHLARELARLCPGLDVRISELDQDPLRVV